jgi:uncharacterized protein YkwD
MLMASFPAISRFTGTWPTLLLILVGLVQPVSAADPLDALRSEALAMVNESRQEEDLPPLKLDNALTEAAQRHAEDMLKNSYFSHVSPTGKTVRDRYAAAGGSPGKYVAENIAQCSNCRIDLEQIKLLHQGWMNSPGHRANILAHGLESFGFGLAANGSRMYAVQTFAGPGTSYGAVASDEGPPLDIKGQLALATDLVNAARRTAGVTSLQGSEALSEALLANADQVDLRKQNLPSMDSLVAALPPEQRSKFASMAFVAGQCEGCGREATAADIRFFISRWLDNPQYRAMLLEARSTDLGVAIKADGAGRKLAIGVVAGS